MRKIDVSTDKIDLYKSLIDQHHKYITAIWQGPTALMATNMVAFHEVKDEPWVMLLLAFFNGAFIFAYWRMTNHQSSIIKALQAAECKLKENQELSCFIPEFESSTQKLKAPRVLVTILGILDIVLLIWAIQQIIICIC